jgi:hypothetical protein
VCARGDSRGQSEIQAANPAGNCILQTCSINRAMNGETLASDMQLTRADHCRGANVIISAAAFNFALPLHQTHFATQLHQTAVSAK